MGNENIDIATVIWKFRAALALSLGGVLYSLIIHKRSKASRSPNCKRQANSKGNHLHFDPQASDKHEENNTESRQPNIESTKGYSRAEKDTHEQEIKNLRNTVRILKERESNLEIELLEYNGLKEQETTVMELQNRLKLNKMEAKFFALKIESLQADIRRFEEQMADYKKVVADLEAARAKIKMLKKRIKSEDEHSEKQSLDFQQRFEKMQEDEQKIVSEVEELRKTNHNLLSENTDLAHRLDCVQNLATSMLEDGEVSGSIPFFQFISNE
ncbi:protein CHUP1, chloroplastic-like [Bidens hawaiensis]|uniref:protein CHUP1, chloroplastic-like n=1 Tax=Bidens hawaiensis TaxID=980011 RepID=UPI00404B65B7